ncbi:MAG: multicopper oxidase family protein [Pseudomonadota bacterium]
MNKLGMSRREALCVLGVGGAAATLPFVKELYAAGLVTELEVRNAAFSVLDGTTTEDMVSTLPDGPPPVLRMPRNKSFPVGVTNRLKDYTTMHWHGLRLDNKMDGVPYLTQLPIGQGERFEYALKSPDAGTFWYHPHCMTMDQMALGLTGILIVEEDEDPGFDIEIPLNLRDFRLNGEGQWLDLWTARGAARGGTFGTIMTTNWLVAPTYDAPTGGLVRVRAAATDTTRIYKLFVPAADAAIFAIDGHPLPSPMPMPKLEQQAMHLGPGQRLDIGIRMPSDEGQTIIVMTDAPGEARVLARLRAVGPNTGRALSEIGNLPENPVPEPDLTNARAEEFVFGWSPEGDLPNNGLCGTLGYTFWSINRTPWPGDAAPGVGPLATFRKGESVVLRLRNESPNAHPIHLHGLVFRPIRSSKRTLAPRWTDTILLQREEVVDIAFVADNPGDWAFHCHVIEHQKTGLAGFIRVLDA